MRIGHVVDRLLICSLILGLALTGCSQDSEPPDASASAKPPRPNVLLIVADDLGYSDIGSFGGEIATHRQRRTYGCGAQDELASIHA